MREKEILEELKNLQNEKYLEDKDLDTVDAHQKADDLLCELLKLLGRNEIVKEYQKIYKWFE